MKARIGVDGGATKTECILVDETGVVLARHLAKGCSPSMLGPGAAAVVKEALSALVAKAMPESQGGGGFAIEGALFCMAGNREYWKEFGRSLTGFGRVVTLDDSFPILELATAGQPGLVLHGGTGSFVAARTLPESSDFSAGVAYAGGLGWRFGDPGSGYDLGRRAVARCLLELQGWMSPSGVGPLVCTHTGLRDGGAISRRLYQGPSASGGPETEVASLAPGLLRLAAERDPAAHAIVVESVSGLLDLTVRVATKLFSSRPLRSLRAGLSGPILTDPTVLKILADRSPLPLEPIREPPIEGVRRMLDNL